MAEDAAPIPKVVILGSGYAGAECAKALQKKLGTRIDLTVVDKRKANIHKIAGARAAVCGNRYSERVLIPNDTLLRDGKGEMLNLTIHKVTDKEVVLEDRTLPFDYLVCATGAQNYSICEPPLHITERAGMMNFYAKVHDLIKRSPSIIIVGGGPTGLELCGEIKYEYPTKNVTLVHSRDVLMNNVTPKPSKGFEKTVRNKLIKEGIQVVMGERLEVDISIQGNKPYIYQPNGKYTTTKGTELQADLVLFASGKKITNAIYPQGWLDERGQIVVEKTLQVKGYANIYAVGDVNDIPENKLAVVSGFQADKCALNISLQVKGKKKLKHYTPGFGFNKTFIFITNGRKKGTGFLGVQTVGNVFVSNAKSKDLFTPKYWKIWGHNHPPKEIGGPSKGGKDPAEEDNQASSYDLTEIYEKNSKHHAEIYE